MAVNSSVFDIMGPIMVGPSSSHTAGACKIGNIARRMVDRNFNEVDFYLHGSFAKTYKGHGTNLSLIHISEPTRLRQLSRMPSSA